MASKLHSFILVFVILVVNSVLEAQAGGIRIRPGSHLPGDASGSNSNHSDITEKSNSSL
ncbi:hypothetical protein Bhyg_04276, partial [Pseudolycoriella hygida]